MAILIPSKADYNKLPSRLTSPKSEWLDLGLEFIQLGSISEIWHKDRLLNPSITAFVETSEGRAGQDISLTNSVTQELITTWPVTTFALCRAEQAVYAGRYPQLIAQSTAPASTNKHGIDIGVYGDLGGGISNRCYAVVRNSTNDQNQSLIYLPTATPINTVFPLAHKASTGLHKLEGFSLGSVTGTTVSAPTSNTVNPTVLGKTYSGDKCSSLLLVRFAGYLPDEVLKTLKENPQQIFSKPLTYFIFTTAASNPTGNAEVAVLTLTAPEVSKHILSNTDLPSLILDTILIEGSGSVLIEANFAINSLTAPDSRSSLLANTDFAESYLTAPNGALLNQTVADTDFQLLNLGLAESQPFLTGVGNTDFISSNLTELNAILEGAGLAEIVLTSNFLSSVLAEGSLSALAETSFVSTSLAFLNTQASLQANSGFIDLNYTFPESYLTLVGTGLAALADLTLTSLAGALTSSGQANTLFQNLFLLSPEGLLSYDGGLTASCSLVNLSLNEVNLYASLTPETNFNYTSLTVLNAALNVDSLTSRITYIALPTANILEPYSIQRRVDNFENGLNGYQVSNFKGFKVVYKTLEITYVALTQAEAESLTALLKTKNALALFTLALPNGRNFTLCKPSGYTKNKYKDYSGGTGQDRYDFTISFRIVE